MPDWDTMRALLAGIPALPGARCKGQSALYERTAGEHRAAGRTTTEELADARNEALRLCETCPALNPCRAWSDSLPTSQRPRGVVAGQVITSTGRPRSTHHHDNEDQAVSIHEEHEAFALLDEAIHALSALTPDAVPVDAVLIVGVQRVGDDGARVRHVEVYPRAGTQPARTHGLVAEAGKLLDRAEDQPEDDGRGGLSRPTGGDPRPRPTPPLAATAMTPLGSASFQRSRKARHD